MDRYSTLLHPVMQKEIDQRFMKFIDVQPNMIENMEDQVIIGLLAERQKIIRLIDILHRYKEITERI